MSREESRTQVENLKLATVTCSSHSRALNALTSPKRSSTNHPTLR
jgi:hypothetical protein